MTLKTDRLIHDSVRHWFEKAVLGLNLCPFAHRPYQQGTIHFELSHATNDESCLTDLYHNLQKMDQDETVETIILICADHLQRFEDYNDFLYLVDQLLEQQGWDGDYQVASFHPDYHFADTMADDRSNWTNRSPYPLLHLIRQESISKVAARVDDLDQVPVRNVRTMLALDDEQMLDIFGERYRLKLSKDKKIPE